jgi:nicotinate-nucleotide adenylyltransferase
VGALQKEHANWDEVFLIIGSDSLLDFPSWKEPNRLLTSCRVIVYPRTGSPVEQAPDDVTARMDVLDVPEIPISSTYLRQRVAVGQSIRYWVPDAVLRIIQQKRLYMSRLSKEDHTE